MHRLGLGRGVRRGLQVVDLFRPCRVQVRRGELEGEGGRRSSKSFMEEEVQERGWALRSSDAE